MLVVTGKRIVEMWYIKSDGEPPKIIKQDAIFVLASQVA